MGKKSLGRIKTIVYGRTFIVVVGFLLQFLFMIGGYVRLKNYSLLVYAFFVLISTGTVLYIFNHSGSPDVKLSWLLPLTVFPVFGAVFYLSLVFQPGAAVRQARLQKLSEETARCLRSDKNVWRELRNMSPHMGQLAYYLYRQDHSPVYTNTKAEYFSLGEDMFPAMLEAMERAERFIFLEYFIVCEGKMWDAIHDVLRRKVKEGVEIRLLYDGTNVLFNLPGYYPRELEREGIHCMMYAPIRPIFSPHYNNRDHRKLLVVDGRVAFTGGMNLADEYINELERFGHWKDTGLKISGAAVERFTYMFLEMWNAEGRTVENFGLYRCLKEEERESDGYVIPYSVNPLGNERVGVQVYLDMINTAHTGISIATPYLILDHTMLSALCYAAKRGVRVQLFLPHIPDKKYIYYLGKTYYMPLLEAGVQIYEYTPGFIHAKMFVVDSAKAVIGTVNLDYRSLYHHFECGVVLYRASAVREMEQDFEELKLKSAKQSIQSLRELSLGARLAGWVLRLIAPLL